MKSSEEVIDAPAINGLPTTLSARTRRVYDYLAGIYPVSSALFHSKAHRCALELSNMRPGMKVLEVATGSGEMFRRLITANPKGFTVGVDLSPNMAARTQRTARRRFPSASAHCQAVDARHMPFRNETFDAIFCCYLLELLSGEDIEKTVREFRRVLRKNGQLVLILIGQRNAAFNTAYKIGGKIAPAFWGRQVEQSISAVVESFDFRILKDHHLRQLYYPSRVLIARR